MQSNTTITPEELSKLKIMQTEWINLTSSLGELVYQQSLIKRTLEELDADRLAYIEELEKKYGSGQINLETGAFESTK